MKGIIFICGFAAGVVFSVAYPAEAAALAAWIKNNNFMVGILR